MTALVKLKQIEQGPAIANAIALAHPPAVVTNNASPFAFTAGTQTLNVPQTPSVTVAGNTLTIDKGDGTAPVTYTPTFPADAYVTAGVYNPATNAIDLTLSTGGTVSIPVADLIPITTADSTSVDFSGDGTTTTPLTAVVKLSVAAGQALVNDGTGLYVAAPATPVLNGNLAFNTFGEISYARVTENFVAPVALAGAGTVIATVANTPIGVVGSPGTPNLLNMEVFINGVRYGTSEVTVTGKDVAWVGPFDLDATDEIEVTYPYTAA